MKNLILLFTLLLTFTANAKKCVVEVSPLLKKYNDNMWAAIKSDDEMGRNQLNQTFAERHPRD